MSRRRSCDLVHDSDRPFPRRSGPLRFAGWVFAEGPSRTRFVWIADILPCEAKPAIAGMIDMGLAAIRRHLETGEKRAAA